jgi:endonuclease/exonuclease/phosphatase family metal-dependent hydrolase
MARFIIVLLVLLTTTSACKNESVVEKQIPNKNQSHRLLAMTYNIRLDVASDGVNAWANRKAFLSTQILFQAPDVVGVQEAKPNQMRDLKTSLVGYKSIGAGRYGGEKGEHSAIFYNSSKLKVEHENTFW